MQKMAAELNNLDTAIKNAIQAVNINTAENPVYCGWTLAMRTRANLVIQDISRTFPVLIQFIEEEDDENAYKFGTRRKIDFYFFTKMPQTNDVTTIKALFNDLKSHLQTFSDNLGESYVNEFTGTKINLVDQLGIDGLQDIGIQFSMYINIPESCQ